MDIDRIDHIVYAFQNLNDGIKYIKDLTGITATIGGQHLNFGTHNALISLGPKCYLELIAPDPTNVFNGSRWMSTDIIEEPTITRWSINTQNIAEDAQILSAINHELGEIITGERQLHNGGLLKWQMTKPSKQGLVEPLPFLLDWSQSDNHPCDSLEQDGKLLGVIIKTTNTDSLNKIFDKPSKAINYKKSHRNKVQVVLETKNGILTV